MNYLRFLFIVALISSPSPAQDSFSHKIQEILDRGGGQGAAISVVNRERILWQGGVGLADVSHARPVSDTTVFQVASVSKIMTGLALSYLHHEGRVNLDAPIDPYLDGIVFRNPFKNVTKVTIRHLLEHTTGLQEIIPRWYDNEDKPYRSVKYMIKNYIGPITIRWQPGQKTVYSNYNYILANHIIEEVTKQPFDKFIAELLFKPLGMNDTSFRLRQVSIDKLASAYRFPPLTEIEPVEGVYRLAAGMLSTAKDLGIFLQFLLNNGRKKGRQILPKKVLKVEYPHTSIASQLGLRLGHGAGAKTRQSSGFILTGHNGIIDGFIGMMFYNRSHNLGFAALLNAHLIPQSPSTTDIRNLILENFFSNKTFKPTQTASVAVQDLQDYEGFYRFTNPRFKQTEFIDKLTENIIVRHHNEQLTVEKVFGKQKKLVAIDKHLFRRSHELRASHVFGINQRGKAFLVTNSNAYYERSSFVYFLFQLIILALGLTALIVHPFLALFFKTFRQMRSSWFLFAGSLCFFMMLTSILPMRVSKDVLTLNPFTASVFFFSIGFYLCVTIACIIASFEVFGYLGKVSILKIPVWAKIWTTITSFLCFIFGTYLLWYGIIGIQSWNNGTSIF